MLRIVMATMKIDNHNEAITTLALPERAIPVLIAARSNDGDGFVSFMPWIYRLDNRGLWRGGNVRRVSKNILSALENPAQRKRVEQEYGKVKETDWSRLLRLLAVGDRLAAGGWKPINKPHIPTSQAASSGHSMLIIPSSSSSETTPSDLTRAFTDGLERSRFVVWWAEPEQKFAPGIYCDDLVTALFALVLSRIGQPGGLGVCRHCVQPFFRSRSKQRYCTYRCQTAAGMRRYRMKLKKAKRSKVPSIGKHQAKNGKKRENKRKRNRPNRRPEVTNDASA
jgi:hypothetical protein